MDGRDTLHAHMEYKRLAPVETVQGEVPPYGVIETLVVNDNIVEHGLTLSRIRVVKFILVRSVSRNVYRLIDFSSLITQAQWPG